MQSQLDVRIARSRSTSRINPSVDTSRPLSQLGKRTIENLDSPNVSSSPTIASQTPAAGTPKIFTPFDSLVEPFWNTFTRQMSVRCPLIPLTDSKFLQFSNPSFKNPISPSWFSSTMSSNHSSNVIHNYPWSIFSSLNPKSGFIEPNTNAGKFKRRKNKNRDPNKLPAERARKIKLYPNTAQRCMLNNWFGTARWTYNRCLDAVKKGCPRKKKDLRAVCINSGAYALENKWVLDTPYNIRDSAMMDLLQAYKTNFAAGRTNFEIKYQSKKQKSQSIMIQAKYWITSGVFYVKTWGKTPIKSAEPLPNKLAYDCRLQRTRLGEFYLCLLSPLVAEDVAKAPPNDESSIIALDPGVRTFQTTYSPNGTSLNFGAGDIGRVTRLCWSYDKLQSRWSQADVRQKQRYRMKRAGQRIQDKIHRLIKDMHHKVSKYLCQNFRTILIPSFESQKMVNKIKRRIGSKTARAMLTWSHYSFRKILENKSKQYPWCQVFVVNEAFTSKTCGVCGHIHEHLGSSKTFKCPRCRMVMDRDVNGARNIFLRFATKDSRAQSVREEEHRLVTVGALGASPL